jgi:hypothetical protein
MVRLIYCHLFAMAHEEPPTYDGARLSVRVRVRVRVSFGVKKSYTAYAMLTEPRRCRR